MPWRHLLLALSVVAVWGTNFVVIKEALASLPPMLLATLRFAFSALPWLIWVPRPPVAWRYLASYGSLIGLTFGLLFLAMRHDITPGLASLVIQSQVFLTLLLATMLQGEGLRRPQLLGLGLATLGIGTIAMHSLESGGTTVTPWGLAIVLCAGLCWAFANLINRRVGRVDMLGFLVWASVFAIPPLLALSLYIDGPALIAASLPARVGAPGWRCCGKRWATRCTASASGPGC